MLASTHKDFQRYRLSDHFVYESYDEESKLFFNRGSIGFVLSGWPIVGASLQAQGEVAEFLKEEDNIPAGTSLQVMMLGSSDIDPYLNYWSSKRNADIFKTLAAKRTKFLKKRAREQGTIKDMSLLISLTVPTKNTSDEQIIDMQRRRDVLISTLESIGILANNVSGAQLLKTLRMFFGWRQEDQPDLNPHQLLSEQLLAGDFNMQVNSEYLLCSSSLDPDSDSQVADNKYAIAALEVAKRPANWSLSMMDLFLGNEMRKGEHIAADFIQSFTLQVLPNQPLEKSGLLAKRESLMKNLKSGLLKWMPNLESEYADMDAAVIAMQGGDRIVMIHQNIILKSKPEEIKKHIFQYRSMMRKVGFHFVPCNNDHLAVLLSAMPMAAVEEVSGYLKSKIGGLGPELSSLGGLVEEVPKVSVYFFALVS